MPSKKKFQPRRSRTDTRPLSLESVMRKNYEPPTKERPDQMASFMGWNGFILDRGSAEQHVGFTRLKTQRDIEAWVMTAQVPYQFALPILSTNKLSRSKRLKSPAKRQTVTEPLHHPWNARYYSPAAAAIPVKFLRNAKGKRAIPTDALDALFFGPDDRKPYYPNPYPWNCIGRLEDVNGSPMGSAALVGRDLILTARHVILGNPTSSIKFVPGYYNGNSSFGPSFFSWVKDATYYDGSDLGAWDFALLRLYQPLGDYAGYFGVRTYNDDWDYMYVWAAAGYPSMAPYNNQVPSYLLGVAIDDEDTDGDAAELDSENQDNSKGNSGGPLWAVWSNGPHVVGVTSGKAGTAYAGQELNYAHTLAQQSLRNLGANAGAAVSLENLAPVGKASHLGSEDVAPEMRIGHVEETVTDYMKKATPEAAAATKQAANELSGSIRVLRNRGGQRGFATVGGLLFTMVVVGTSVYAISQADNKIGKVVELGTSFVINGMIYKLAGGGGIGLIVTFTLSQM
jgi:V8-like Glu-specific endopeptidase